MSGDEGKNIFSVSGKVAVVTGASGAFGRAFSRALAANGADIALFDIVEPPAEALAEIEALGRRAVAVTCNVMDRDSVQAASDQVVQKLGKVDILVNNAGITITKRAEELTDGDWNKVIGVDLKGVFNCSVVVGNQMIAQKTGGKIINIASVLGLVGDKQVLPYCVAKGGVIQMTRALGLEWARYDIRVNAICPGYIKTPLNEADLTGNEKIYNNIISKTTMRRLGEVDELLGALLLLASDASSYMTGQYVAIDGGYTAA